MQERQEVEWQKRPRSISMDEHKEIVPPSIAPPELPPRIPDLIGEIDPSFDRIVLEAGVNRAIYVVPEAVKQNGRRNSGNHYATIVVADEGSQQFFHAAIVHGEMEFVHLPEFATGTVRVLTDGEVVVFRNPQGLVPTIETYNCCGNQGVRYNYGDFQAKGCLS